jgi:hypothetical protein
MLSDGHFKSFWNPAQGFLYGKGVRIWSFVLIVGLSLFMLRVV